MDGKIKLEHVADMLGQLAPRGIAYQTVLMDSWYATTALFKWLLMNVGSKGFEPSTSGV